MQFTFTEEQDQFRDNLRKFLADKAPPSEARRLMETETGFDPATWRQLAAELGVCGIHVPERYGGAGFGMTELCIVLEEMGRSLFCGPYFSSTVLAATAILEGATEEQKESLLPGIASGECKATLALTEADGSWEPESTRLSATPDGRLTGSKSFVVDGHIAERILVLAREAHADELSIYVVEGDAEGLTRTSLQVLDPTRKLARLDFDRMPGTRLGSSGQGEAVMHRVLQAAAIALANEAVGGAGWMLDSALDYTKLRMQFGRKIGSFQAIKHRMADLLLQVELARSGAYYAAAAHDAQDANLPALASLAKSACSEAFMHAAAECIQLHGGIGFTWDQDTHLWYRRAKSSEVFLGDPAWHRDRMIACWHE